MIEDGLVTHTSTEQHALEQKIAKLYSDLEGTRVTDTKPPLKLLRQEHIEYLYEGLEELPPGYASLDAGRPWICFWIIHSLGLLNASWPDRPHKTGKSPVGIGSRSRQASSWRKALPCCSSAV